MNLFKLKFIRVSMQFLRRLLTIVLRNKDMLHEILTTL